MIKRIVFGIVVVGALVLLILYSQWRVLPPYVSGIVESDEIRLGSRVGGRVSKILVDEGDTVTAGMPLVEFEPYDLLERERQALAELAVRQAELKRLTSGLRAEEIGQARSRVDQLAARLKLLELGPRQEEIEAAQQRLNAANAEMLLAKREYDRRERLIQSNSVAQSDLEAARERLDGATANFQVKSNELAILKQGARPEEIDESRARVDEATLAWQLAKQGYRIEEIEQAEAARDVAAAAVEVVRQQKSELTIVAPSDGFVDALDLQAGDLVGPNAPVMTIVSVQHLWVRGYVPQRFLKVAVGEPLRITIDSFPDEDFRGTVSFVSHQAEFTPSNVQTVEDRAKQVYRIRVSINDEAEKSRLRPGMTANIWLSPLTGGE